MWLRLSFSGTGFPPSAPQFDPDSHPCSRLEPNIITITRARGDQAIKTVQTPSASASICRPFDAAVIRTIQGPAHRNMEASGYVPIRLNFAF